MDYVILNEIKKVTLENIVEIALRDGWKLAGGVAVVWDGKEKTYYQAIKKS